MVGRLILKWAMMLTNTLVACIMVITLLGTVLSPELFILPAYFSLIFPIIIAINIGFVIFWIIARKWFALLSLSILLFSTTQIKDIFPIHIGQTNIPSVNHPISILTYNMKMSGNLQKHTKRKPNKVIQYILDANADIVCLQEFTVSNNKEYIMIKDMYNIFNSKYPYKHIQYRQNNVSKKSGVATFSKYPIIKKQKIPYQSEYNVSIFSDINIDGKMVRLINNHLESNRLTEKDKGMPITLKDSFNAENLSGVTLHFSRKLGVAYKLRAKQADAVAKVIATSPYKVIVCGDFNDVPASYSYTKIKGSLHDAFSEIGTGFGWTFNEGFYHFRIDFVLYDTTAFVPIEFKVDKVNYSDHFPVLCKLDIQ